MSRPAIPAQLRRDVLVESGHRCAIPTCKQPTTEIAHIEPWASVKEHAFDNLIALCPNCHTRYDRGEIDRKAMRQYKWNLSVLNGRYGEFEQRVLRTFAKDPRQVSINLPNEYRILIQNLLDDGFLIERLLRGGERGGFRHDAMAYHLSDRGRELIRKWLAAEELD